MQEQSIFIEAPEREEPAQRDGIVGALRALVSDLSICGRPLGSEADEHRWQGRDSEKVSGFADRFLVRRAYSFSREPTRLSPGSG